MTLGTVNLVNYSIFLIMGDAGFSPSAVGTCKGKMGTSVLFTSSTLRCRGGLCSK